MNVKRAISGAVSLLLFSAAALAEGPASDNGTDALFASASSLEASGDHVKAAENYLYIISSSPRASDASVVAEGKLKAIYDAVLAGKVPSLDGNSLAAPLRNMYNNFKTEGKYDKALAAAKALIRLEELPEYYSDLGNIYVYGFNDPASAIPLYRKAFELGSSDYKVYTDMGLAYELLGDNDKAVVSYKKAASISPLDPWCIYGLKRAEGIDLASRGALIKDWLFLGSFRQSDLNDAAEKEALKGDTKSLFMGPAGEKLKWLRPYDYGDSGYVNLNNVCRPIPHSAAYALTCIYSPSQKKALFKTGSDDGIVIWLNGDKVWDNRSGRAAAPDEDSVEVTLRNGWNKVVLKITQGWGGWGFYFRVTDPQGKDIPGLVFDPLKDEKRAASIVDAFRKEEFIRALKAASSWTAVFLLVLLLFFFLISAARSALRIERMRRDFTSSVTHDLKIPLSAIMASAEMLSNGKERTPQKTASYLSTIGTEANRLNRYINMILDSHRSGRKRPFDPKRTDIVPIVKKAIADYGEESPSEGLVIRFTCDGPGEIPVMADEAAILQVLMNLLNNADKYSPKEKHIEVSAARAAASVKISIKDHGIGIHKKDLRRIFRKYYRAETAARHKVQGIGLGLAFVKDMIESHKGSISVSSMPGKGSTFTITLPISQGERT